MRLLLDTRILLWALSDPARLEPHVRTAITAADNLVFVSAATAWEISIKRALGRIEFPIDRFETIVTELRCEPLSIRASHAIAAGGLPRHHNDPFDRMLIAQARIEQLVLVTADRAFTRYDVPILGRPAQST